jgi:hypothetical protein
MSRPNFRHLLFVVVAIFGLLALSGALSAQGFSHEAFERVKEVQERHTDHLLEIKGVVGTAVGFNQNDRPAVKIFVARWDVSGIPKKLDDVPVQAVVTGKFYALGKPDKPGKPPKDEVDPTARFGRPVPIGVSTGHPDITAGTIGCRVTDGTSVYALSNNHVYANENEASLGDNVLQPGPFDGGKDPADAIGTLAEFEPINFGGGNNMIDAAIARSSTDELGNATPSDGYGTPKQTTVPADLALLNQPVKKYGRTTGLTKGRVYATNATVDVGYDSGVARFSGQIVITPGSFSAGGDSGSLVVLDGKGKSRGNDRKAVGFLFAGSSQYTIANPIDEVLTTLGVTIDGD